MVMSQNIDETTTQAHWLSWLEGASVVGGIGGAIATAIGQPAAFAVLPLSLAAALGFVNRSRMKAELAQAIRPMLEQHQGELVKLKQVTGALPGTDEILMIQLNKTHNRVEQVAEFSQKLQTQIDALNAKSEAISQTQSALLESTLEESYYRRGLELERRGEFKDAISAYNEALRINANYADAHMQLGIAYAHNGQKQQAIVSLRIATKLFFESGNLDRYHEARAMSEQIHGGQATSEEREVPPPSTPVPTAEERLVVNELFV